MFTPYKLHVHFIVNVQFIFYTENKKTVKEMWKYYNPNPCGRNVGDCSVRAIAKALDVGWETAFVALCYNAMQMCDMPSSDSVWGSVLRQSGFVRSAIPNTCPDCYTAEDFCEEHPRGVFVLGFGGHVATVVDGVLFDSWDSSQSVPQFYWELKE